MAVEQAVNSNDPRAQRTARRTPRQEMPRWYDCSLGKVRRGKMGAKAAMRPKLCTTSQRGAWRNNSQLNWAKACQLDRLGDSRPLP
jgi:hypothetical protein